MERDRIAPSNLIDMYLAYVGDTECPATFHRWSALTTIGAYLGRQYFFQHGHSLVNPNIYVMLMGSPGTRKSTAIKIASSLIKKAGYATIAATKTTKEKFLCDLAGESDFEADDSAEDIMERNLFGSAADKDAEILIAADEFNVFIGNGNIEFLSLLGTLWDYDGIFEDKKKNSKSLKILNPTVSMLAGNTPTGFALAFPPEAIGQGIFSRLLLVHGESTGKRITFPKATSLEITSETVLAFQQMKAVVRGPATLSPEATAALDSIYQTQGGTLDVRFESYSNRRFTHLLKLCLITSAASLRATITLEDVVLANTILTHTEHTMSKALGEFGKARHSDIAHKILQYLESKVAVVTVKELWKQVHNDMEDIKQLRDMLSNLTIADKIIAAQGGFLARRKVLEETSSEFVDFSLLTEEERRYIS